MAEYIDMPKPSEADIKKRLAKKVPAHEAAAKWHQILEIYRRFITEIPDIGGKKNFMWRNLYGAIACFAWYEAFDPKPTDDEMRELLEGNTIRGDGTGGLSKINIDNPIVQKIIYAMIQMMAKKTNKHKSDGSWGNTWEISVNPLKRKEGLSMHLVGCPIADFAKSHGYEHLMPIFCESDYQAMKMNMGKNLYREHTVVEGYEDCDYWIKS